MKTLEQVQEKQVRGGGMEMMLIAIAPILANLQTVLNTLSPNKDVKDATKADAKAAVGKESTSEQNARKAASR